MENQDEKIYNKLDKMNDHLSNIDVTLASQHISLENHIQRTTQLEERMKPIEEHVILFSTFGKIVSGCVFILGVAASIFEILEYFKR